MTTLLYLNGVHAANESTYRIWRPAAAGLEQWTNELYSGPLGAPLIDQQPGGLRAALRLLPARPQRPETVRIEHVRGAIRDYDKASPEIIKKHEELRRRHAELNQQLEKADDGERARAAHVIIAARTERLTRYRDATLAEYHRLSYLLHGIDNELKRLRAQAPPTAPSFSCRTVGVSCDKLASETQKKIAEQIAERERILPEFTEAKKKFDDADAQAKQNAYQVKQMQQISQESPAPTDPKIVKARTERERVLAAIKKVEGAAHELAGWYTTTRAAIKFPAGVPECKRPLIYRAISREPSHPLFAGEVDKSLLDFKGRSLVVCTEQDRPVVVSVFDQTANPVAYAVITRTRAGDVARVVIKDDRDRTVEEHQWIKDDETSWFGYTFADAEGRLTSVYANASRAAAR